MLEHPPERHSFQVAHKQRRPERDESAADITDDENEEDQMVAGEAVFVHSDPRSDQEHRGASRPDGIAQQCPRKQKKDVHPWFRPVLDPNVDASGNNKERPDHSHKAEILAGGIEHRAPRLDPEDVVTYGDGAEAR